MTKLFVEYTDYEYQPAMDINPFRIHQWLNPIIVCAREGQKTRLLRLQRLGKLRKSVKVAGWWDLGGQPIDDLFQYDAIFVLDPERIGIPAAKQQWERIIECLK
jgi:hypothetical protein